MNSSPRTCSIRFARPLVAVALLSFLIAIPSRAALISVETVFVNSANPAAAPTTTLLSGVDYVFEARGTYFFAFYPGYDMRESDAQYFFYDNGPITPVSIGALRFDGVNLPWMGTTDGINFAAGTYSSSHIYRHSFVGDGLSHSFNISDTHFHDNVGTLSIEIFRDTGDSASVPDAGSTLVQLGIAAVGLVALIRRKRG